MERYNPFNADKILTWTSEIEKALSGGATPPITINVDPTTMCNMRCFWCNAWRVMEDRHMMSREELGVIAGIVKDMGVKAVCIAGGGEPALNPYLVDFLGDVQGYAKCGLITNGIRSVDHLADLCEWIGFSVDSGKPDTFKTVKGVDRFNDVIGNIKKVIATKKTDVTYKFLACHENHREIHKAALLARDLGVSVFHVRPVSYQSTRSHRDRKLTDIAERINEGIEKARSLETDSFKVASTGFKFGANYEEHNTFPACRNIYAATFCADGYVYSALTGGATKRCGYHPTRSLR